MMLASPLAAWLARYGYVALALGVFGESAGIPVPGETLLLATGALTAHGQLSLVTVILIAAAAGVLGDNLDFAAGRRLGRGWLERHGHWVLLTPPRLVRLDAFFERFGPIAVALARFVTGVRVVAAFAAGASRMRWSTFLLFNVLGAALWATVVALAGAALGLRYSFPSGHSTASAAVACTLAYVLVRERLAPRAVLLLAALFALIVGLSRIYLDVHWATDVIGGWSMGVGIAMLSAALYERAKLAATAHEVARR